MTEIKLRVDGKPTGKGRPRFSTKTGRAYTDDKTKLGEARVIEAWNLAGCPVSEGCLMPIFFVAGSALLLYAAWRYYRRALRELQDAQWETALGNVVLKNAIEAYETATDLALDAAAQAQEWSARALR